MNNLESREIYVESELNKWRESYVVKPEQEFMLKSMFELQYQFKITPDDHVRTKKDLIETIQRIMNNLRLVPVLNKDRFKVLVMVNNDHEKVRVYDMFQKMFIDIIPLDDIKVNSSGRIRVPVIDTKEFEIRIEKADLSYLRGTRADYILNLSDNKEIDEYFREQNKLK